ncbi:hypothetical protein B7P34_03425 [Streptosporangium nondiastaticum]|uniref:Uncharacterized protein n=1 Tax=Streptosporangium nondiastaticum TaxID=35764 RepID=A0A9X7JUI4_9ACTN|nr:hypothetical protein [Streptosporangium nondiastaticum]PSJ30062.1 hypothetical protein B7P34_03425 [Streptosporangium nondiastaticum]
MNLRPELLPPPVSRRRLDETARDIDRIADLVTTSPAEAAEAVRAFNERTGRACTAFDFATYHGSRSREEFAGEAARPARPRVADVTRDELVEIVRRITAAGPDTDHYLTLLEANVPHPRVRDLLFAGAAADVGPGSSREASLEEIVDEALAYRGIAL